MASILPQCSWCGGELKENELRKSKEEILQRWEKDKKDNEHQKNLDEHGKEIRKDFERGGANSIQRIRRRHLGGNN